MRAQSAAVGSSGSSGARDEGAPRSRTALTSAATAVLQELHACRGVLQDSMGMFLTSARKLHTGTPVAMSPSRSRASLGTSPLAYVPTSPDNGSTGAQPGTARVHA
jgi:hypothetical protein